MENDYYGAPTNAEVKPIRERLRTMYEPEDFVTVINGDTKPLTYQFAAPQDQETYSDYPGHKNTIMKRPPQRLTLQPGQTKLVPAYEADLMIEAGVKQMAMSKLQERIDGGLVEARQASTDWTDPFFQTEAIKRFYVGKKDILAVYNTQPTAEVAKDLELDESRRPGRPRKEV